jgi:hypothetical protein
MPRWIKNVLAIAAAMVVGGLIVEIKNSGTKQTHGASTIVQLFTSNSTATITESANQETQAATPPSIPQSTPDEAASSKPTPEPSGDAQNANNDKETAVRSPLRRHKLSRTYSRYYNKPSYPQYVPSPSFVNYSHWSTYPSQNVVRYYQPPKSPIFVPTTVFPRYPQPQYNYPPRTNVVVRQSSGGQIYSER